jgi:hypothetical protein
MIFYPVPAYWRVPGTGFSACLLATAWHRVLCLPTGDCLAQVLRLPTGDCLAQGLRLPTGDCLAQGSLPAAHCATSLSSACYWQPLMWLPVPAFLNTFSVKFHCNDIENIYFWLLCVFKTRVTDYSTVSNSQATIASALCITGVALSKYECRRYKSCNKGSLMSCLYHAWGPHDFLRLWASVFHCSLHNLWWSEERLSSKPELTSVSGKNKKNMYACTFLFRTLQISRFSQ